MTRETTRLLTWTGALSMAAALVHGLLTGEHFAEWWGYGAFFAFATVGQALYGLAILGTQMMHGEPITRRWDARTRRAFYAAGIAGNLLLVAMYVVSRTVGIPFFGPEAGEVEAWSALGIVTKAMELAIVALLAALLARSRQ